MKTPPEHIYYAKKLRTMKFKQREIADAMGLVNQTVVWRLLNSPLAVTLCEDYAFGLIARIEAGAELSEKDKHVLSVVTLPSFLSLKETAAALKRMFSYGELTAVSKRRAYDGQMENLVKGGYADADDMTVKRILKKLGRVFDEEGSRV